MPGLTDLEVFARGGYATVYRATQQSVGREVAVKVENRSLDSERDQRRFMREARAAGRMSSHPHVVDLFDVGVTADQHPYLIMEMCDGSYADRMRNSPLGAAEARDVGVKIADALADAHQLGVLHRDVKPANILYSRFNEPALADFGLAIIAETRDSTVTLEVLTPAYAPPEMFSHHPPGPAVDVYALCATLYAIMNGRPPRWQDDLNPSLIGVMELFNRPVPDLPGIPPALVDVLRLGMANDPARRPSAEQLRDMLAAVPLWPSNPGRSGPGAGAPVSAPPVLGPPNTAVPAVPGAGAPVLGAPAPDDHPTVPNTVRPTKLQWFLGGLAAVALLVGVAAGSWHVASRNLPVVLPTEQASRTPAPTQRPPELAGGALRGCLAPLPSGGRCPAEMECFGPMRVSRSEARAERVPCGGRHTWETYAKGDLPAEVDVTEHEAIKADSVVRQICAENTFRTTTLLIDTTGWQFEVLPPTGEALAVGDRVFRCLAGRGVHGLTGPTLGE
nr:protein kinase [Micromonospora sp. DSM 115978]